MRGACRGHTWGHIRGLTPGRISGHEGIGEGRFFVRHGALILIQPQDMESLG